MNITGKPDVTFLLRQLIVVGLCVLCTGAATATTTPSPKREFRATWFTTHYAIDWPKTKATSSANITKQKKEMTDLLDKLQRGNLNAVCFQTRPVADAYYQSSYEPWGINLTGVRGKNPGYDPLAYMVSEGHKRGMEVHAWVNPFRYEVNAGERTTAISNGTGLAGSDPIRTNYPDWLLTYSNGTFNGTILDPGNPAVRDYVVRVLMEIVNNYDIDGILMDDYFYAYGGTTTEDAASVATYKPSSQSVDDWRRENVNKVIHALYDSIQSVKPWVKLGMGPGGIYSMQDAAAAAHGVSLPSGIRGGDPWATLYCDPLAWVDGGYLDYLAPQVYWATTTTTTDYDVLCRWWGETVQTLCDRRTDGKRTHLFISQASYRFGAEELGLEIDDNRAFAPYEGPGSIFYNTNTFLNLNGETSYITLVQTHFTHPALTPAVTWKSTTTLPAPTNLTLNGVTLTWQHPTAERFSVYMFPKGMSHCLAMSQSEYLQGMVYGKTFTLTGAANLDLMTIAVCTMDRYGNEYGSVYYNDASELPVYSVVVSAADTDMGSVSGGGEYMQGAEVVLTATPEYGYEFTGWQDGNTDNPRTVIVTGEDSYTALFEPQKDEPYVQGSLTRELLWQKTLTQTGYMSSGNANRSITVYGDSLYVSHSIDGGDSEYKYHIVNTDNGSLIRSVTLPDRYMAWNNIRMTEDGVLLLGNSATAASSQNFFTATLGGSNISTVASLTNSEFGRTDYFYPIGRFGDVGYALMLSNVNHKVLHVKFKNGEITDSRVVSNAVLPSGTSAKAIPVDAEMFFATTAGHPASLHSLKTGALADDWSNTVNPQTVNVSGLCYFTLAGHKYLMTPADAYGAFDTFEITDGLANAASLFDATPALGTAANNAYTVDAAVRRRGNEAYVYLLAPNNGIAAYRYTFTPLGSDVEQHEAAGLNVALTDDGISLRLQGTRLVEIYNAAGLLVVSERATDIFEAALPHGVYMVKTEDGIVKVVR